MLSARTFQPSRFQTAAPADLTELRLGPSYAAATERSFVCVVRGGEDRWTGTDVVAWVLAFALRLVHDVGGRPASVVGDLAVTKARMDRAYAAVGTTSAAPIGSSTRFPGAVLVALELSELAAGEGVIVGRAAGQILDRFARAAPAPPPVVVPPMLLATSTRLGSAGLPQLLGALAALQNDKASTAPPDATGAGLGLLTALRPGDSVLWGNIQPVVWTVWSVDVETRDAWEVGGHVVLRDGRGTEVAARALQCARTTTLAYLSGDEDLVLNNSNDHRGRTTVNGAVQSPVMFGQLTGDPILGGWLAGHCSYVDVSAAVLRTTRWAVWRPGAPPRADPSAVPPLLRDFAYGPSQPGQPLVSCLLMMQDVVGRTQGNYDLVSVPKEELLPFWDVARNLAFSLFLSLGARPRDVLFPGAVGTTRMLVLESMPSGDLPRAATNARVESFVRRYKSLALWRMLRLWIVALGVAMDPASPRFRALTLVSGLVSVELERYSESVDKDFVRAFAPFTAMWKDQSKRGETTPPGMTTNQATEATETIRDGLVSMLWRHTALDWCKAGGVEASLGPTTTVVYCDWSQRLLAFAAASHVCQGWSALVLSPGDPEWDIRPVSPGEPSEADGIDLVGHLRVMVVHQQSPGQILPPGHATVLALTAPPPTQRSLLQAVQQSARVFAPAVEVPVVVVLGYAGGDTDRKFKSLANSVDIGRFVRPAPSPTGPTGAWAASLARAPAVPTTPGVVRLEQLASPELIAAIETTAQAATVETAEWRAVLTRARGLEELACRAVRLASFEGGSDLNTLPPDSAEAQLAPAIDSLAAAIAKPLPPASNHRFPLVAQPAPAPPAPAPPAPAPPAPASGLSSTGPPHSSGSGPPGPSPPGSAPPGSGRPGSGLPGSGSGPARSGSGAAPSRSGILRSLLSWWSGSEPDDSDYSDVSGDDSSDSSGPPPSAPPPSAPPPSAPPLSQASGASNASSGSSGPAPSGSGAGARPRI
jgi:hypothetical protein